MPICIQCSNEFSQKSEIDGQLKLPRNQKMCIECCKLIEPAEDVMASSGYRNYLIKLAHALDQDGKHKSADTIDRIATGKEGPCWDGYEQVGFKMKDGKKVPNCVPIKKKTESQRQVEAAEYQGKKVTLNKPFRTKNGPKKFSVYVKNDKGNVVKVNFGDPNMEIKRDDPDRRKNFRARHNCSNPGPKWKARYWSCKMWSSKSVSDITD
jgi:hypothetical protein